MSQGCTTSHGRVRSSGTSSSSQPWTGSPIIDDEVTAQSILSKKLKRQIAEQLAKQAKYHSKEIETKMTGELELEKLKLKQQERLLEMQYQREWEKEAHELQMLQMQLTMQGGNMSLQMVPEVPHPPMQGSSSMPFDLPGAYHGSDMNFDM